mgnify:FL=1
MEVGILSRVRIENLLGCGLMLIFFAASIMSVSAADDENVLKLGIQINEFKLMNSLVRPWYDSANFFSLTNTPLVIYRPDLDIAPGLASSWEIAPDGKSIKFSLVENATWSDGKPVTAEDVAFSFDYWKKNKLYSQGYWYDAYLDHSDIIDNHTVNVFFNEPVAVASLTTEIATTSIIPKHIWEMVENTKEYDGPDGMVGCGPFIFEKFDKDAQVVYLKANSNYFSGKPAVGEIEWHYYRTQDALILALKKGDIDAQLEYYNPVPGVYAADLIKPENVELVTVPDIGVPLHLVFGLREYPTNVKEFRQAISYAIDYQALVDMIAAGYGDVPGKGYCVPQLPGYNPNLPKLEHNITKANELLNSSGFVDKTGDGFRDAPNGAELKIPIDVDSSKPQQVRAAEIINLELQKVGLNTFVESLSPDIASQKLWTDRDYCIFISKSTPYGNLVSDSAASYYVDIPGMYGTSTDQKIIDLVEKAMYSRDQEELLQTRSAIQEYVAENLPMIALIWGDAIYPVRTDRWEGWTPMYGYGPVNYWSWFSLRPVGK